VNQGVEEWVVPQRYSSGNIEFGSDRTNMVPKLQELAGLIPQEVSDVLLIPHHPGSGTFPTDWRFWYPSLQRVVEITSWWGTSEVYGAPTSIFVLGEDYAGPGHYVRDALNLGVRTGVIGSSDSHDGQPGYDTGYITYALGGYKASIQNASASEAKYGGLTGLYVKDLSLNSIFDALKARRTMASANERRIRTDLRINGHWQGEELNLLPGTSLDIQVDVVGQDEFEYIEVIRNGELFASVPILAGQPIYSIQLSATAPQDGTDYYYVRVKQLDTAEGFSSPIWITADPNSTPVMDWSLHE